MRCQKDFSSSLPAPGMPFCYESQDRSSSRPHPAVAAPTSSAAAAAASSHPPSFLLYESAGDDRVRKSGNLLPLLLRTLCLLVLAATAGTAAFSFSFSSRPGWQSIRVHLRGPVQSLSLQHFELLRDGIVQDWHRASLVLNKKRDTARLTWSNLGRNPGQYKLRFSDRPRRVCPRPFPQGPAPPVPPSSFPIHLIGNGTARSCTEGAIREALSLLRPLFFRFHCGPSPVTITIHREIELPSCHMAASDGTTGGSRVPFSLLLDGRGRVTLAGSGRSRLFSLSSSASSNGVCGDDARPHLRFENLRFTKGAANDGRAGAVFFGQGTSVDFVNCDIFGNAVLGSCQPGTNGSACARASAIPPRTTGAEDVNEAPPRADGGAVSVTSGSSVSIVGCRLWHNSNGRGQGGALAVDGVRHVYIRDSWFFNNSAVTAGSGGGVYVSSSASVEICGVVFKANTGRDAGGGLAVASGDFGRGKATWPRRSRRGSTRIPDDDDAEGMMEIDGAWEKVKRTSLIVCNCLFDGNILQSDGGLGGGLFTEASSTSITGSIFLRNAGGYGGGVHFGRKSETLGVQDSVFAHNMARRGVLGAFFIHPRIRKGLLDHVTAVHNRNSGQARKRKKNNRPLTQVLISSSIWDEPCGDGEAQSQDQLMQGCLQTFGDGGNNFQAQDCGVTDKCSMNFTVHAALGQVPTFDDGAYCTQLPCIAGGGSGTYATAIGAPCNWDLCLAADLPMYMNGDSVSVTGQVSFTI